MPKSANKLNLRGGSSLVTSWPKNLSFDEINIFWKYYSSICTFVAAAALAVIQIFVMTGTRKSWPGLGSHDRDSAVVKSPSAVVKSASAVVESWDGPPHPRTAGNHLTRSASGWHSIDLFRKKITPPNLLGPQWTFRGWFSKHYTLPLIRLLLENREQAKLFEFLVCAYVT